MTILLTGASSFTGMWFAERLAAAGHHVVAPLRGRLDSCHDVRGQRVRRLAEIAEIVEDCVFGETRFLDLMRGQNIRILCHHAANVSNYKSIEFDVARALRDNTLGLPEVLRIGLDRGLQSLVLTGTVFEQGEGAGSRPLCAFSPYGLSKGLTSDTVRFWCEQFGLPFAKFVIPNPFGPFEKPRFCHYLMQCWTSGRTATVATPAYVRDNIHVSLLARAYADFVGSVDIHATFRRLAPSGYVETQGAFAQRFAREIGSRLSLECPLELAVQTNFPEPLVRINTDIPDPAVLGWSETGAWDELANFYGETAPFPRHQEERPE